MEVRRLPEWVKTPYDMELHHSGVKNMRWGERRYQNLDGSLTPLGRVHYGVGQARTAVSRAGEETRLATSRISGDVSSNKISATGTRATNLGESGTGLTRRASYKGKNYLDYGAYDSSEHIRTREERTKNGKKYVETIATRIEPSVDFLIYDVKNRKHIEWASSQLGIKTKIGEDFLERDRKNSVSMQELMDTNMDEIREMEMKRYSGEGYTSSGSPGKRRDYSYSTAGIRKSAGRAHAYHPLRGEDKRW